MKIGQRTKGTAGPTDRRILDHARRAFNERGVAAVGIREIARDLGLSPGNVSYHFPTKEALVTALVRDGHAQNTAALVLRPVLNFEDLADGIRTIMRRDVDNQWLLRDYVGLMVAMPALRELHDQLQGPREARADSVVADLVRAGLLDADKVSRRSVELRRQIFTQMFFWLPSAVASAPDRDPARSLDASARAVMALFLAYCTPAGHKQLDVLLG
jgi:AcrR family transcriptional regulator